MTGSLITEFQRIANSKGWTFGDIAKRWQKSERQLSRIAAASDFRDLDAVAGLPDKKQKISGGYGMGKKQDFFFGDVYQGREGKLFHLRSVGARIQKVSKTFLTAQLNRALSEYGGSLIFTDETSSPNFWELINQIVTEDIGFIEIYARYDVNDSVKATLGCDIILLNGILSVQAHWCAYKEIRTREIIDTLLVPLHLKNLQNKTYIRWDDGRTEPLLHRDDYVTELKKVLQLANYPTAISYAESYKTTLECATEAGLMDSPSERQLWETYRRKLDSLERNI